ncbi:MAG: 2-amino-4-hydroxy-6-hydroxymethyldihydropteridine diphosphokinase [Deltaproteobacteria bacterium]|nr:2-amino-4-hydroxy-6-hydroxymethyldihydropteridine diphosphokinase [Deltaproteobacteria bacterium]
MESAYIGVGSNIGHKIDNCKKAIFLMGRLEGCSVRLQSPFYRTEPVGVEGQDTFVNGVVCVDTDLSAASLLKQLLKIETDMGRVRLKKWDARVIDLDILLFGDCVINKPDLIVPHPLMHLRRFVLTPLLKIAPDLIHPVLCRSIRELAGALSENGQAVENYERS